MNGDYFDYDDDELDAAMARSLGEESTPVAGPSHTNGQHTPSYILKPQLQAQLAAFDAEMASIDEDIVRLQKIRVDIAKQRKATEQQLRSLGTTVPVQQTKKISGHAGASASAGIDYTGDFEWSGALRERMKQVFGIGDFRLCQEGVCNANMDGRDIVCVMPTGGGKSLTYQLPAILSPGCTLVISPLISLITDQILHLQDAGIEAVMLTGATSKEATKSIFSRLTSSGNRNGSRAADGTEQREIKLCYVTPEKIAKSKVFGSVLEKMATAGRLARIVIDEAHCVSQLGHDFRPDYKKLSILRQLFPHVPILALSATCPPKVLQDLLLTLRLKPVVDGRTANRDGTCYFSAPLYRKNLHYQVVPKPSSASAAIKVMADYIMRNHRADSGIVYCLSKKDTETIAAGLNESSGGVIKTGVYHSEVGDSAKEQLHIRWREGKVKVVCATIAFGLGIDKGDVRFVLHHSMSKSLEGFYQESGRAGRDGKDADCIMYFRSQDASRLASLTCGELEGQSKLHDILRFALDKQECRKIAFANYFSASTSLSLESWSDTGSSTLSRCGHCDNCTRPPESIAEQDVTFPAWQICKVAEQVDRGGGRLTVAALADLVRGNGGASFGVVSGKGRKKKAGDDKVGLDLVALCGGKVALNKDDAETLIIQLILSKHLQEDYHSTAYSINVYAVPGTQALRLTRLTREAAQNGTGSGRVKMAIITKTKAKRKSVAKKGDDGDELPSSSAPRRNRSLADFVAEKNGVKTLAGRAPAASGKGKDKAIEEDIEVTASEWEDDSALYDNSGTLAANRSIQTDVDFDDDEVQEADDVSERYEPINDADDEDDIWQFNLRDDGGTTKTSSGNKRKRRVVVSDDDGDGWEAPVKPVKRLSAARKRKSVHSTPPEIEVVELSSD